MDAKPLIRKSRLVLLIAAATGLLAACATDHPLHLGATHGQISDRIANARTASDHQALAQFFHAEAEAAKKKADEHKNLTQIYTPGYGAGSHVPLRPGLEPSRHCQALAGIYERAAEENRAMAKIHEELAAQARKAQ